MSYERRAREWDTEQLTQEKLLAADARKQDEENRPKTYVFYFIILLCYVFYIQYYCWNELCNDFCDVTFEVDNFLYMADLIRHIHRLPC